jgi:hypothetical protein
LKSYLRIESTAENALLAALLARAQAQLEMWMDCPITAESQTYVDTCDTTRGIPVTTIIFPRRPIANVSITDGYGAAVPSTEYWVNETSGVIVSEAGYAFSNPRYSVTADCGLSLAPWYARIEPMISQCIIDMAADLYQRRTPSAAAESSAGTSITWDVSSEVAQRVRKTIRTFKLGVAM